MNMLPCVLLLVVAVNGAACGRSTEQPTGAATDATAATAAEQASPTPTAATDANAPQPSTAAAAPAPAGRGPVMARVNGTPIYKSDYDSALANFMQSNQLGPNASDEQKKQAEKIVLDGLIGSELLFQKAKSIPIEVPQTDVDQAITKTKEGMGEQGFGSELQRRGMTQKDLENLVRQNLMVQKLIQEQVINTVVVSDVEMKSFYDGHQKEMEKPEDVEASHILTRMAASDPVEKKAAARKKIDEALKRVKGGEEFAAVAKEYSEDSSAANGGSLGVIHHGQTVPAFEEVAFKLPIGQVSEVVQSQFGFHIIKVTARHPAGLAPFPEVKDRIAEFLKQSKSRNAIEQMVSGLRASAKIDIL